MAETEKKSADKPADKAVLLKPEKKQEPEKKAELEKKSAEKKEDKPAEKKQPEKKQEAKAEKPSEKKSELEKIAKAAEKKQPEKIPEKIDSRLVEKPADRIETQNIIVEDRQKLLELSEISLWLDGYDDIFSDFDPRPYSQRSLSDDFVTEAKKFTRDKPSGKIELKFLIPENKRVISYENLIKKRLREHFKKHYGIAENERKALIKRGLAFTLVGIILMIATSLVAVYMQQGKLLVHFLIILLEPASWFLFWEGLRLVIFEPKAIKPEYIFYKKMSNAEIKFLPY